MKFLALAGALAFALAVTAPAQAAHTTSRSELRTKHTLHLKITRHLLKTWDFQDRMNRPRSEWKHRGRNAAVPLLRRIAAYWEHRHYRAWKAWVAVERSRRAAAAAPAVGQGIWDQLAGCESGGDWAYNGGSGFDGGLQFHPDTWSSYRLPGYPAYAYQATREQQIAVAQRVLASSGWGAWPACSAKLGLR